MMMGSVGAILGVTFLAETVQTPSFQIQPLVQIYVCLVRDGKLLSTVDVAIDN